MIAHGNWQRAVFTATANALSTNYTSGIVRQLREGSINYILIEKEISSAIMLLRQLILFQRRNVVC